MVLLDFQIDENVFSEDLKVDPKTAPAAALEETYFFMPVRFVINGVDIFERSVIHQETTLSVDSKGEVLLPGKKSILHKKSIWCKTALLYLAISGFNTVKSLLKGKKISIIVPEGGYLDFELVDNRRNVIVRYSSNKKQAIANFVELLQAFHSFSERVRKFFVDRIPEFKNHPTLGSWFSGQVQKPDKNQKEHLRI